MRDLPPALAAAIASPATTLARCWRVMRRDGLVRGFTDHDRDLVFDGVTYEARTGVEASEIEQRFGFAVGGGEMAGALESAGLSEADLARGLWDAAAIDVFVVDWTNVAARVQIESGAIGEVRRSGAAFTAELRSLAHRLDQERGRIYAGACSAAFGDARCGVDLAAWRGDGVVVEADGAALITATGLESFAGGLFRGGAISWSGGANDGLAQDVRDHSLADGIATLSLWAAPPAPVAMGDGFVATAGCDKRFATCRDRFANAARFRGFPHIPGNDLLLRVVRAGEANMDGGSLFR